MYTYLLAAIVSAALSGFGVWKVQEWRYGAKEAERAEIAAEVSRQHRNKERKEAAQVIGAVNEARKREQDARTAAADALLERDSLHNDLAKLRNDLPGISANACKERVKALTEVFEQCTDRYIGMAGKAQRHSDDTDTLEGGWPK